MSRFRLKAIGMAPNFTFKDVLLALSFLVRPWAWSHGTSCQALEKAMDDYLGRTGSVAFTTGRGALMAILEALQIGEGDEVLLQGFTCVAIPNALLWSDVSFKFVDIDPQTLNMDPRQIERHITPKTKAILVQHTLGQMAPMPEILAIAKKHQLKVIEDCAHALGATMNQQKAGLFSDAAFFSFGRDKVISSVFGGLAYFKDNSLYARARSYQQRLSTPSSGWIFKQLIYLPLSFVIRETYYFFSIGKVLHAIFQKLGLLSRATTSSEKRLGEKPDHIPTKMSNALCAMALGQLTRLDANLAHRKNLAHIYQKRLTGQAPMHYQADSTGNFMRYSVFVVDPLKLMRRAKDRHYVLGDWYNQVIAPKEADMSHVDYRQGDCPQAEKMAKQVVNLPTSLNILPSDAEEIAKIVLGSLSNVSD